MQVCRTCLERKDLISLFGERSPVKFDTFELFMATGIQIKENDGLPQVACKQCIKLIKTITQFKETCEKTNNLFQMMKNKIERYKAHRSNYNQTQDPFYDLNYLNQSTNSINIQNGNTKIEIKKEPILNVERLIETSRSDKKGTKFKKKPPVKKLDADTQTSENIITLEDLEASDSENDMDKMDYNLDKLYDNDITNKDGMDKPGRYTGIENTSQNTTFVKLLHVDTRKPNLQNKERKRALLSLGVLQPTGKVECKLCHSELVKSSFLDHAKRHFPPEFSCEYCEMRFHGRAHMRYHQERRHGRRKRLACRECGFRAAESDTMRNHIRLEHTGERPYTCDECGADFRMRRGIVQHMRKHSATKDKQCDRCPKMFKSLQHLWLHKNKVHLLTYTYSCYLCSETYRGRLAVKRHIQKAHGIPFDQQMKIKPVKIKK